MWNNKKKSAKQGYIHQFEINHRLSDFAFKLQSLFLNLEETYGKGNVTKELFRVGLSIETTKERITNSTLLEEYKEFIRRKSKTIEVVSIQTYNTTLSRLVKYEKSTKINLTLNDLNSIFYSNYCGFCFETLELAPNTVGRDIKNLKAFINDLKAQGLAQNINTSSFKGITVPSFSIALTEQELQKIYELDLTENQRLHQVRIKFLLACYTGMRIGDLFRFSAGNITEKTFEYAQGKTGEIVYLPRHDELNKILEMLPKDYKIASITEQRYNKYLKELCELAGINEEIQVPKYSGRNKVYITKKKFELVTSHTARKTFATIGITKGIPAEALMKFTGHSDLDVFLKYVKIPHNLYMDIIRKAWSK
jgi:integrase